MNPLLILTFTVLAASLAMAAPPPGILHHQGRIAVNGENYTGTGHFKFVLLRAQDNTSVWSNNLNQGEPESGTEPPTSVPVPVVNGHYSVLLGDPSNPDFHSTLFPTAFSDGASDDLRLRIWFSSTGAAGTFELLAPDRRLTTTPHAFNATYAHEVNPDVLAPYFQIDGSRPLSGDLLAGSHQLLDVGRIGLGFSGEPRAKFHLRHQDTGLANTTYALAVGFAGPQAIIEGTSARLGLISDSGGSPHLYLGEVDGTALTGWIIRRNRSLSPLAPDALQFSFGTPNFSTVNFTFTRGGALGIGTSNPIADLHVVGNGFISGALLDSNQASGTNGQVLSSSGNGTAWTDLLDNDPANELQTLSLSGDTLSLTNGGTADLAKYLRSDTSDAFTSGILTFNPGTTLNLDGTIRVGGDFEVPVAMGSTTPNSDAELHVAGPSPANTFDETLRLEGTETSGAADTGAAISFSGNNGGGARHWGWIRGMKENGTSGDNRSYLAFATRSTGGPRETMRLDSNGDLTTLGTVNGVSDRDKKENFAPIDLEELLEKIAALPIARWNYKHDDRDTPHLGPVAQDFHAAFGLGADDKHIATVDADGVALAAIQALKAENDALQARLLKLEALVGKLVADPKP